MFLIADFDLAIGERVYFGPSRRQGTLKVHDTVVEDDRFVTLDDWGSRCCSGGMDWHESQKLIQKTLFGVFSLFGMIGLSTPIPRVYTFNTHNVSPTAGASPRLSRTPAWASC